MNKKHQIAYTKPNEPAFLTEFKKRAGFVEADTVDTKVSDKMNLLLAEVWLT